MNNRSLEKVKEKILKHKKLLPVFFSIVSSSASIIPLILNWNKYITSSIVVVSCIFLCIALIKLLEKATSYREVQSKYTVLLAGYAKTHTLMHEYNEIRNIIDLVDPEKTQFYTISNISSYIIDNLQNLKTLISEFSGCSAIHYSFKEIEYLGNANITIDQKGNVYSKYKNIPFTINDIDAFRDKETKTKNARIDNITIHHKDSDSKWHQSLFYKSFQSGTTEIAPEFSDVQKELCNNRYIGGLVSPVRLYNLPISFICFCSEEANVFDERIRNIVNTFCDGISEYIRIYRGITTTSKIKSIH